MNLYLQLSFKFVFADVLFTFYKFLISVYLRKYPYNFDKWDKKAGNQNHVNF